MDISFNYPWTLITPFGRHLEYDVADRATFERHADFNRVLTYDALGRLATFTDIDTATLRSHTYVYDSVANRRDHGSVLANGNRLTRIDQYNIFYDSAGNVLMKAFRHTDTVRYTWNVLGQLTRVIRWTTAGTDTTSYLYDGWGRRIRQTVDGAVTHYLHNGAQVVMELNSSYTPVTEYSYLPGVDQPHSVRTGGKMYYFARDGLGSVIGLIDTVGMAATTRYDYTPVGEILVDSGTVLQPFRFKGLEWDAAVGLYYMRARYYDPQLGRFISEDPLGLAGGINPYAFVMGDPVNRTDPLGLQGPQGGECVRPSPGATPECPPNETKAPRDQSRQNPLPWNCFPDPWEGIVCLDDMGGRSRGYSQAQWDYSEEVAPAGTYDNRACAVALAGLVLSFAADVTVVGGAYRGIRAANALAGVASRNLAAQSGRRVARGWAQMGVAAARRQEVHAGIVSYVGLRGAGFISPLDFSRFDVNSLLDVARFVPIAGTVWEAVEAYEACSPR